MIKSLFWSFLEQGGAKVVSLIVQIVLARLLAPDAFGVMAIMLVIIEVANVLSQSGLGTALIQRQNVKDSDCDTALWLSVGLSLVFYIALFFTSPLIASFYGMPDITGYLRTLALAVPLNAANSIQRSLLQKNMAFKTIFKSNLSAACLSGIIGVSLAATGFGIWALVAQAISQALIACIVMLAYVPWRPSFRFDCVAAGELFSYGWKICVTGILNVVHTGVSELILGKAVGASSLGLYSQGRKWPNAGISMVSNAIQNVMFPAFAELQDDAAGLKNAIRRALSVGSFVVVPIGFFLIASAGPLVDLLLTDKWAESVPVFQFSSISTCFLMVQLVNLRAYMALGDSGLYLKLQIIKVVASCAVVWPTAIITHDIYYVAAVVAAVGVLNVVFVDLVPARRMHGVGFGEQLRIVLPIIAVAAMVGFATWAITFLELNSAITVVIQILVFIVLYSAVSWVFRIPGLREVAEQVKRMAFRTRRKDSEADC